MIWVSIILGLIEAIPGLIKLIQQIIAALHAAPPAVRLAKEPEFHGILAKWFHDRDSAAVEHSLAAFEQSLVAAAP